MADEVIVHSDPEPEVPAEVIAAVVEAAEVQAEAAVEIAQIEADRDITLAETHAEAELERHENQDDNRFDDIEEGLNECRRNSETALTLSQETQSLVQSILERLPPEPVLPNPNESPESAEAVPPEAESPPEPEKKKSKVQWT